MQRSHHSNRSSYNSSVSIREDSNEEEVELGDVRVEVSSREVCNTDNQLNSIHTAKEIKGFSGINSDPYEDQDAGG